MKWIRRPNLPETSVKRVVIGKKYGELAEALDDIGKSVIQVPDNKDVDPYLAGHADLSLFHMGDNGAIVSRSIEGFAPELEKLGFELRMTVKPCAAVYPGDVGLNACLLGNKLFHNLKYSDAKLRLFAAENHIKLINVKQGYAKCSICAVDDGHIITEDKAIARAASSCGVDCLLITPGHIRLEGFGCGFIGGAAGKLADNVLAFTGTLKRHPDERRILDYLTARRLEPLYLTDKPCYDVGSIIPVNEE